MLELHAASEAILPVRAVLLLINVRGTIDRLSRSVDGQDNQALVVNVIVFSTLPHETFFVYGRVHRVDVRFLIDIPGLLHVSLLNSTVWRKITAKASVMLDPWFGARLVGVDGSQLRVFGQARLPLVIGTETIFTSVDALATEGILGMDFLRQHRCTIDYPGDCSLHAHQGITVPLQRSDCSSSCYPVRLVQTVKISPRSEIETVGE